MKRSTFLVSMLALAIGACAGGGEGEQQVGAISLALKTTHPSGVTYRLRNATFRIAGYPQSFGGSGGSTGYGGSAGYGGGWGARDGGSAPPVNLLVSTEEDPEAELITRRLLPGFYTVSLGGDWHLERTTPAGAERVPQVVLLSPVTHGVSVWDGGEQRVSYRFGVDGTEIDFRSGDLSIDIEIVRPEDRGGPGGAGGAGGTGGTGGGGGTGGAPLQGPGGAGGTGGTGGGDVATGGFAPNG